MAAWNRLVVPTNASSFEVGWPSAFCWATSTGMFLAVSAANADGTLWYGTPMVITPTMPEMLGACDRQVAMVEGLPWPSHTWVLTPTLLSADWTCWVAVENTMPIAGTMSTVRPLRAGMLVIAG